MAQTPLSFTPVLTWVDVTDPNNIPPAAKKILAADLLRYENSLTAVVDRSNLHTKAFDANAVAVGTGFTVKLLAVDTAGRPSALDLGPGASIFDTTLKVPLWSDGTNWVDATGTVRAGA